jgi:TPR repeat protein
MRRPDRNFVLSLLAFAATFAQGWQREREMRIAAAAQPPLVAQDRPLAAQALRASPAAARSPRAAADPERRYDEAALDALVERLFEVEPAAWTAADVDALHAMLADGAPMAAMLLLDHCLASGDCSRLGPALESRGDAGDVEAASMLAELYTAPGFPGADPVRAFGWLARYAELGDAEDKRYAALRALERAPEDRPEWRAQALAWLAAAVHDGSPRAALELLKLSEAEAARHGLAPDPVAAERWYAELRRLADPRVLREAAIHYQQRGDAAGTARAVELWSQQGEVGGEYGSNNAAWLLAVCGRGLEDHERAWRLIQREHRDHGETWQSVDTLAAVQARLGMWGDALATQQRALDLLAQQGEQPWAERELRLRLDGYAELRAPSEPSLCPPPP